ncbi:MAG: folylpolyglutamate synthase/dihydrofolate synthase family protein [Geminicoccaceae bacterium]
MTAFDSDVILARLQSLHPKSIDLSLDRILRLLDRLDNPELRVPPVVHIAGTNGKGSTLAMLHAMLEAEGRRVHRYISPHLVRFNERILLYGQPIDEGLLADVLDRCERANRGEPITFFEITTAAAFLAFAECPADWLLLETGLGGRLDATNVVPKPVLTLISPVSMDHEAYLGSTLEAIAGERPASSSPGAGAGGTAGAGGLAVLDARAEALAAPLRAAGRDWHFTPSERGFRLVNGRDVLDLPQPGLVGAHQIENAALAAVAGQALGLDVDALGQGIRRAVWPARLQRLNDGLAARLPAGAELWLDGGHNPAAGQALALSLDGIAHGRPVDLVLGMLETKDVAAFLAPMQGRIRRLLTVPVPNEHLGRDPAEVAALARQQGFDAEPAPDVEGALDRLGEAGGEPAVVLICGSLYLAGHVLRGRV